MGLPPTFTTPVLNKTDAQDEVGAVIDTTAFSAYIGGGTLTICGVKNDLLTTGNKIGIAWAAVSGAVRYNVYKESNGLYGYIGQTAGTVFVDDNIAPDLGKTRRRNTIRLLVLETTRLPWRIGNSAGCSLEPRTSRKTFG